MSTLEDQSALAGTQATAQPQWQRVRGYLVRPAIIYLILLTQVPLLLTLYYSLTNWNFLRPDRTRFVGLANYVDFFRNPDIITIIRNTLVFSMSVVLWSLVLGMILALLLNRQFRGRGLARTLLITPFLIMPTVSAVMWKNMLFNPAFGLISSTLAAFGGPRIDWMNNLIPSSCQFWEFSISLRCAFNKLINLVLFIFYLHPKKGLLILISDLRKLMLFIFNLSSNFFIDFSLLNRFPLNFGKIIEKWINIISKFVNSLIILKLYPPFGQ